MASSICGNLVKSKRTLLALGWLIVNVLAIISFSSALAFALISTASSRNDQNNKYYNDDGNQGDNENENENANENDMEISVTSRAMAFTGLWTMVLSTLVGIYGTVILGFVSPFGGTYYWCCRNTVHKTTPMVLGSFIGALLMYANLTLVCSVLFGEFKVRDYSQQDEREQENSNGEQNLSKSSTAFSILCMFLTILYAGFAALVFTYSNDLLRENDEDERREALKPSEEEPMRGYIGNKFTVRSPNSAAGAGDTYIQAINSESGSYGGP
jgi:flagellar basal body-associated protein FliL